MDENSHTAFISNLARVSQEMHLPRPQHLMVRNCIAAQTTMLQDPLSVAPNRASLPPIPDTDERAGTVRIAYLDSPYAKSYKNRYNAYPARYSCCCETTMIFLLYSEAFKSDPR